MAIYHCSCKVISRNNGRSAVGASAYRSGEKIENERDGIIHDYTRKEGIEYSEILLPENAPQEWSERSKLWNEVERAEKTQDSQLAREYEVALPKELTMEQNKQLVKEICEEFRKEGMCVDYSIHRGHSHKSASDFENDESIKKENPHVHIMCTIRPLSEEGKWENKTEKLYLCKNAKGEERAFTSKELAKEENAEWKKQYHYSKDGNPKGKKIYLSEYEKANNPKYAEYERIKGDKNPKSEKFGKQNPKIEKWNSKEYLLEVRKLVAEKINMSLERYGHQERVDHRSYQEQGIEQIPTIHIGTSATQMERKGIETERGNINREIRKRNEQIKAINREIKDVKADKYICEIDDKMQSLKNAIPKANEEELRRIQSFANQIDRMMEGVKNSGAFTGKEVTVNYEQRIYIPKMEYEQRKYKKSRSEMGEMLTARQKELVNEINKNLEQIKERGNPEQTETKIKEISKEYKEIKVRLQNNYRLEYQPIASNQYSIAYNNAEKCLQEIEKNQGIFDRAKEKKANLSLLARSERKSCDSTMKKAQENIKNQMESLSKLGIQDINQAKEKMKEFTLKDQEEKQMLVTFKREKAMLENRAEELETQYKELKASLPREKQERIAELEEGRTESGHTQGKNQWKSDVEKSQAMQRLERYEKSVQEKLIQRENERTQNPERTR